MVAALLLVVLLVGSAGIWALWTASRRVPSFYAAAAPVPTAELVQKSDSFEQQVLEVRNTARHAGRWETVLTAEQINAWLALELPRHFPGLLPSQVSDPRVAIEPDAVLVGARYRAERIDTVISLELNLFLTDDPQVVAVRVRRMRAGLVPLPASKLIEWTQSAARRHDLPLRWNQSEGAPVALLTLPERSSEWEDRRLRLERLELRAGEVLLAGRSD